MPQRTIARREDDTPPPARGSVIGDNLPSLAGDAERLFDEMLAEREGFNDRVEALVDAGKRADALQIEDMDEGTAGRLRAGPRRNQGRRGRPQDGEGAVSGSGSRGRCEEE